MNIYVGNFPHAITEDELTTLFKDFGYVNSTKIILDKYTGKPRGFAFIEMDNKPEALKAITTLDGKELNGRTIKVSEAKPRKNQYDFGSQKNRW
jgi:RNA recognition motif-containing protein